MRQLNQILIEGLLTRSTPDVYHLTDDERLSITVYIDADFVEVKPSEVHKEQG